MAISVIKKNQESTWKKKLTNFIEDIQCLLPMKFSGNPYSSCQGKVENALDNIRLKRPNILMDHQKHKQEICDFYSALYHNIY